MTAPGMGSPPPPAPPRTGAPRWAIAVIAAVAALVVAAGVFVALTLTSGTAAANEVTREPVNTAGANPFMPAVGTDAPDVTSPTTTGGAFRGDTPGLYGGTRDNRTCDAAKLTGFLNSHPSQAAAWASVLNISTSQIDSYVSTLTPVLLRSDTSVTNHGYVEGRATVVSSVLQAGSAVFVDKYGSPVVRCACGNPLTAPTLLTAPAYVGPTWVSFNQTNITVVQNTTTVVNNYTLVDPYRYQPFVRIPGYRPGGGFEPPRDERYTGSPLPIPDPTGPGQTEPGQGRPSGPSDPGPGFDPMDAKCPDGTWVRSGGQLLESQVADLNGDGQNETAVLVECAGEQLVSLYDRAGRLITSLPQPTAPPGSPLPPRYDDNRFVLDRTSLTIDMDVYGADDTEATGPTERQTWRWLWNGSGFTLAPDSVAPVRPSETSLTPTPTGSSESPESSESSEPVTPFDVPDTSSSTPSTGTTTSTTGSTGS